MNMALYIRREHKGFTLIHLVLAMVIFCILSGIAFWGSNVYITQANYEKVDADLQMFETNIQTAIFYNKPQITKGTFCVDTLNKYLSQEFQVTQDAVQGDTSYVATTGTGVYNDPWGHPYHFDVEYDTTDQTVGVKLSVTVASAGKDAAMGTEDDRSITVQYPAT